MSNAKRKAFHQMALLRQVAVMGSSPCSWARTWFPPRSGLYSRNDLWQGNELPPMRLVQWRQLTSTTEQRATSPISSICCLYIRKHLALVVVRFPWRGEKVSTPLSKEGKHCKSVRPKHSRRHVFFFFLFKRACHLLQEKMKASSNVWQEFWFITETLIPASPEWQMLSQSPRGGREASILTYLYVWAGRCKYRKTGNRFHPHLECIIKIAGSYTEEMCKYDTP